MCQPSVSIGEDRGGGRILFLVSACCHLCPGVPTLGLSQTTELCLWPTLVRGYAACRLCQFATFCDTTVVLWIAGIKSLQYKIIEVPCGLLLAGKTLYAEKMQG